MKTLTNKNGASPALALRVVRRWRRARPHCGGVWLWREGSRRITREPVALELTPCGREVEHLDDMQEGTPQYYWEQTETTQRTMPGLWMQSSPNNPVTHDEAKPRSCV